MVAILGARQVGKTSLALDLMNRHSGSAERFDLEDPADLARLADPGLTLGRLNGLIVIDEIQRHHNLFSVLRVLADRRPRPARFLVLGSGSPELFHLSILEARDLDRHTKVGASCYSSRPRPRPAAPTRASHPTTGLNTRG